MIESFIQSWDLFATTYLAGLIIAVLLALVGVVVVARDQVFIGASVAQASTLGIALALTLTHPADHVGEHEDALSHGIPVALAVGFAAVAALLTVRRPRPGRDSRESLTAWVFLLGACGSVLLTANSPHSLHEIERLLTSSIISATEKDVVLFSGLLAATLVVACATWRTLLLLVIDEETAEALGVRVRTWNVCIALTLGSILGVALHVAGLLYVFGCLVLPAMLARNLCRSAGGMFIVAPALALPLALTGFILANHHDYPPAHTIVALMAAALPVTWGVRRLVA